MGRLKTVALASFILCGAAGIACYELCAAPASTKGVSWQSDLIEAHKISVKDRRPMLIVFGADWCTYCKKLDQETFRDRGTSEFINANFVPVHLNYDEHMEIAKILEVTSLPTTVILSADADLLGTVVKYVRKDEYRKALTAALEFDQAIRKQ